VEGTFFLEGIFFGAWRVSCSCDTDIPIALLHSPPPPLPKESILSHGSPLTRYICRGYALRILHLLSSLEPDLQNSIATSYLLSLASLNSQIDIKKSYFLGAGYVHWLDSGGT
jgi:hypothetical protein